MFSWQSFGQTSKRPVTSYRFVCFQKCLEFITNYDSALGLHLVSVEGRMFLGLYFFLGYL